MPLLPKRDNIQMAFVHVGEWWPLDAHVRRGRNWPPAGFKGILRSIHQHRGIFH